MKELFSLQVNVSESKKQTCVFAVSGAAMLWGHINTTRWAFLHK